jgi:hypothetical protein
LGLFFCFLSFTEQLSLCKWVRSILWHMVVVLWCGASWARLMMVWSFSLSLSLSLKCCWAPIRTSH